MHFDDWKELMEEGHGHDHDDSWKEWTDTTIEERDAGTPPLVDEFDVWAWLKMSTLEIRELLTKPHVSAEDSVQRERVDIFVWDCYERGVSMAQLGEVLGLYVDLDRKCKSLTRSIARSKLTRLRQ